MSGPELSSVAYLQLGQLTQLLGSIKDELSALEETEKQQRKGRQEGREERRYYPDNTGQL